MSDLFPTVGCSQKSVKATGVSGVCLGAASGPRPRRPVLAEPGQCHKQQQRGSEQEGSAAA